MKSSQVPYFHTPLGANDKYRRIPKVPYFHTPVPYFHTLLGPNDKYRRIPKVMAAHITFGVNRENELLSSSRHASSYLVAAPTFKIISLGERYSKVFDVVFNIIFVAGPGVQLRAVRGIDFH